MQSLRTRNSRQRRVRFCAAVLSFFFQTGCLDSDSEAPSGPPPVSGTVDIEVAPWRVLAARTLAVEPGGRLIVELRDPSRRRQWIDSLDWDGGRSANLSFRDIPQGGNYLLVGRYRDGSGRFTHADSLSPLSVSAGEATSARLGLRALVGRLVLGMPSVPATVDSLMATWMEGGRSRRATAGRGTGGRTVLRLDSLPVGTTGAVTLRAWNSQGDTLYSLDTSISVMRDADQSISLVWRDASARPKFLVSALPGGEVDATVRFPGEAAPDGRLRISGLSDSGSSDWILLENPGSDTLRGSWKIAHGTESAVLDAVLPPGGRVVATRAACETVRGTTHALGGVASLVCGVDLPVSWTAPNALWELRDADGDLVDQVFAWDGQNGWPDLNASTARTLRRRSGEVGADAMAGRSWCATASADPAQECP
ncbi:MAG TPA: hypothetical protein PKO15_08560 [Fibrobacteria bacterium]|nr:hypothetical protein [Fibrobacteria bacterium]HOX50273.1 hypothetical protein [Fibrobacteria bacterium]